jgi:biotin carboxyl carrier protein
MNQADAASQASNKVERERLDTERQEAERLRAEEERKLAEEQVRLEEAQKRLAAEQQRLAEEEARRTARLREQNRYPTEKKEKPPLIAKAPSYSAPQRMGRQITGKDGAPSETGTLAPIRTLDIKSQFSGEVLEIFVREGEQVVRDQPLIVIRQEPSHARQVAQLRAKLEQEGFNVAQARRNLVRMDGLHDKGFIARQELESAEQEAQQAMVRRELAEKELLLALGGNQELFQRYISQDPTETGLEEFRVSSPSDGTIIDIGVQPGEIITSGTATVGGGTVLMKLADLHIAE